MLCVVTLIWYVRNQIIGHLAHLDSYYHEAGEYADLILHALWVY